MPIAWSAKIDNLGVNEKEMARSPKKNEAPPDSGASRVRGMEANRTPSQSIEQTDAKGAPSAVFVRQYQPNTRSPRSDVDIPGCKAFKQSRLMI